MVDDASTEFAEELLSTESFKVMDGVRPQMQDVVARKTVSLFHDDDTSTKQSRLNRNTKTHRPSTNYQHLHIADNKPYITYIHSSKQLVSFTHLK